MRIFRTVFALVAALLVSTCANGESLDRFLLSDEPARVSNAPGGSPETRPELSDNAESQRLALVRRAGEGDAQAAYALFRLSTTIGEERKWICVAANLGLPKAQAEIARMYWRRPPPLNNYSPFHRDIVKAFVWGHMAMRSGESMQSMTRHLTQGMSEAKLAEAERLVNEWVPDPEECE